MDHSVVRLCFIDIFRQTHKPTIIEQAAWNKSSFFADYTNAKQTNITTSYKDNESRKYLSKCLAGKLAFRD